MKSKFSKILTLTIALLTGVTAQGQFEDDTFSIVDPAEIREMEMNRRSSIRQLLDQPYPIRRLISAKDIKVQTQQVRLRNGKKATLVVGSPRKVDKAPAVFVIDVESSALAADPVRWFRRGQKAKEERAKRVRYLLSSPFGSNLLGNGFVVAYLIAEDIETLRSARTADWLGTFEKVRTNRKVDSDSFFLLSTREYANLSLYLASNYSFSGVILEEPHYMLFSKNTYKDIIESSDRLTEEEIWMKSDPSRREKYQKVFSTIHSPLLLVRARNTNAYTFNEKTLIPGLLAANAYFEEATVDQPARYIDTLGSEGVMDREPNISYNLASTSIWLEHMIDYLRENSRTEPVALASPLPNFQR